MIELTKENYDAEVLEKKGTIVIDFWGDTCVRCMQIMPGMEELEQEFGERAVFAKVNIQGNRRLAMRGTGHEPAFCDYLLRRREKSHDNGKFLQGGRCPRKTPRGA